MPDYKITDLFDKTENIAKAIGDLSSKKILVGVPEQKSEREGTNQFNRDIKVTNAEIGYWNEFGVPENNLPARPHLRAGVKSVQKETIKDLKVAIGAAFHGNKLQVDRTYHKIGMRCQNAVRGKIQAGLSPKLAESTLRARRARGRKGKKPLYDTGEYLRSITYVIRNNRGEPD